MACDVDAKLREDVLVALRERARAIAQRLSAPMTRFLWRSGTASIDVTPATRPR
jgi:hypothetical protein